jgi:hypothetical protein
MGGAISPLPYAFTACTEAAVPFLRDKDVLYEEVELKELLVVLLSSTNKMQCYTIFFIIVNVLHVLGGFSAHHQELKNCTHSTWYMSGLLPPPAVAASKPGTYQKHVEH